MFIFGDVAKVLPLVLLPHYVVAKIAKLSGYKKCKYQLQYTILMLEQSNECCLTIIQIKWIHNHWFPYIKREAQEVRRIKLNMPKHVSIHVS